MHASRPPTSVSSISPTTNTVQPLYRSVGVLLVAGAKLGALEITAANKQHLRSAYTRRRLEELAVLTR